MLITFLLLFVWVMLPKNKKGFDDAANLPFEDEEKPSDAKADNGRTEK